MCMEKICLVFLPGWCVHVQHAQCMPNSISSIALFSTNNNNKIKEVKYSRSLVVRKLGVDIYIRTHTRQDIRKEGNKKLNLIYIHEV